MSLGRVLEKENDLKGGVTVRCNLNLNLNFECWAGGFENGSFGVLGIGRFRGLCGSRGGMGDRWIR